MQSNIFRDLEQVFELGFGRPRVAFRSVLKDQMPAFWEKTETGFKALVKTLGLDRVNVELNENACEIIISGKNTIEDQEFDTTVTLPIIQDVVNNIMEIKHKTLCGVSVIELIVDRPARKQIKVTEVTE